MFYSSKLASVCHLFKNQEFNASFHMVLLGTDRKLINNPFVLLQLLLATPLKLSLTAHFLYKPCCELKWPAFEFLTEAEL